MPVEGGAGSTQLGVVRVNALARLSCPLPWLVRLVPLRLVAEFMSSFLSSSGVIVGRCWSTSAAAPATTAAA